MDAWIGPALVAAIVSGFVSVLGWFATFYIGLRRDRMLREEKINDFQVALRAEIASDLLNMVVFDREAILAEARERYAASPAYSVVVPHVASNPIFESVVREIHILPSGVIEPIVHYERFRQTIERFAQDLRAESFHRLPADRQLTMYADYLDMLDRLEALAQHASAALESSLNSPGAGRLSLGAAPESGAAASQRNSP